MATDVRVVGYPKNLVRGKDFDFSAGCGGGGAGFCYDPADFGYIWWRIFATNFVVKNRKLTLQNIDFKSYLDAGSNGICAHSEGASQDYDIVLSYASDESEFSDDDYNYNDYDGKEAARVTIPGSQTLPFEVTFNDLDLPQPTDPRWSGIFTVVIDLKNKSRMVGGITNNKVVLKTTNYDYDERL